jgi:WD40 repeat protein
MENGSIVDQHCPEAHTAPITGAAYDSASGASITSDENGTIAITRGGEEHPNLIFAPGDVIYGAVAVAPGGSLVACGDESGSVYVFNTWDGTCVFEDVREGPQGQARAMRALAFNHQGTTLAALSIDGIIRVFDIQRWERIANYQGYGGESIQFDDVGERLLVIDTLGQPKLIDMMSAEMMDLEMVPGGVRKCVFTPDASHVVCMGQGGITLIELPDGRIVNSFTARGSSGMLNIVMSPDGDTLGAVTGRSVHVFTLPDLGPDSSDKHGAPEATTAAIWDWRGIAVGGTDGMMHRPGEKPSLSPIVACGGFGYHRVASHGDRVAVWHKNRRKRPFKAQKTFVEMRVDRGGKLLAGLPDDGTGVKVFQAHTGRHLFDAGEDTADTTKMEVGGHVFACMLPKGGMRWYDIKHNNVLELPWVQQFALSGGGTWIAAITPKGRVKVLDPATGKDAIPAPEPLADVPIKMVSFVNRRPDMLVMDDEGVLGVYDLTESVKENVPAIGQDVLDLNVDVDRLWGITGGEFAAVRFQEHEEGTATIIFVNLAEGEVVSEIPGLLPYCWVDPETGTIMQPARGNAILEMDMHGRELRVLRSLPEGEWICFDTDGVLDASNME